jgi:hypothetical protein
MVKVKVAKQTLQLLDESFFRSRLGATDCALGASGLHYTTLHYTTLHCTAIFLL